MAQRFQNPFPQFWSSSSAYSGGTLYFYASGGSTPLAVYSDKTAVTSIGTSVTLNSAGRYVASDIFLQNVDYRVILKDSDGVAVWTADPVRGSDFTSVPLWSVGSGSPSGLVAGTAGSSGVMPSAYWDYLNSILYFCTTTGVAAAAVWTAVNATATQPAVPPPQGRLTLTSATPVLAADVVSATSVYYTPYVGSLVPIYSGSVMTPTTFSELTLTLAAQHAINTLYDVFVFSNSGVVTLATGPAWTTSTAGSGARGTGASTTQLSRVGGLNTNAVQITGRNGATTYTIGANLATYVGSLYIDGVAGQVTCHQAFGQNRKWGVWNAFNRMPVMLKAGDSTASWTYGTNTIRAQNNVPATYASATANVGSGTASNSAVLFSGLAEDEYIVETMGAWSTNTAGALGSNGVGYNSITAASGLLGVVYLASATANAQQAIGKYVAAPALGINIVTLIETCPANAAGTVTAYGTEAHAFMVARWMA